MNIWSKSILIGLIPALAFYFLYDKIIKQKKLVRYDATYSIKATANEHDQTFSLRKAGELLKKRVEMAGWKYTIKNTGADIIAIKLLGIADTMAPPKYLVANNRIEFREMYTLEDPRIIEVLRAVNELIKEKSSRTVHKISTSQDTANLSKEVKGLLDNMEKKREDEVKENNLIQFTQPYVDEQRGRPVFPPEIGKVKLNDTAVVSKLFLTDKIRALHPPYFRICYGEFTKTAGKKEEDSLVPLYILNTWPDSNKAMLENDDIADATVDLDIDDKPQVLLQFNQDGAKKWRVMTEKNIDRPLAIIINGTVISAPTVLSAIDGGSAIINGNYTFEECQILSTALTAGRMPFKVEILNSEITKLESEAAMMQKQSIALALFLTIGGLGFVILKVLKST